MIQPKRLPHAADRGASTVRSDVSDEELVDLFRGERLSHDNKEIYRGRLERRLLVNRCTRCGTWHQPARPICSVCWSTEVEATPVSGRGTIFMTIFLHQGPPAEGVDYTRPHPVVTVELAEQVGLRITSTVVGASNDEIRIGRPVELDWIERGGVPVPVFRLVEETSAP